MEYNFNKTPEQPKEVDVFNRFSKHNKFKLILLAILIVVVTVTGIYFFSKSLFTYTLKIVADGGTLYGAELPPQYEYKFLEKSKLPEGLKKEGYYIAGFYTDSNFEDEYKFGSRMWNDVTVYIDWQPGYAVQLEFVNGEDHTDRPDGDKTGVDREYIKNYYEQYVKPGSVYTLPEIYNHVKTNVHYGEKLLWYTNSTGAGEPISSETFTVDKNIKIYGRWFDVQDFKFDIDKDGVLHRYLGSCENIILPNSVKSLKDIDPERFLDGIWNTDTVADGTNYSVFDRVLTKMKILYVNKNVELLGRCAFRSCVALTNIKFLGNKIEVIPDSCFKSCIGLKQLVIPSTVTIIGEEAFHKVENLVTLTGTENVTEIYPNAFTNCYNLTKLQLDSLDIIHKNAFQMCIDLVEIYLGNEYGVVFAEDVLVADDDILLGAVYLTSPLKIYIPDSDALLTYYQTTNFWSKYASRFQKKVINQ